MNVDIQFDYDIFLPKYRSAVDSDADIIILWGGRDSGKTHFAAQKLLKDCLEMDYFKCILSRKVQDTIRDSQFATLIDIINEWGLQDEFKVTKSPMEITCRNGNKFVVKGADIKGKAKGTSNPTHLWGEEWNQVSEMEYLILSTSLRSNNTKVQEVWTFNPEPEGVADYTDFWIYKYTGDNYTDHTQTKEMKLSDGTTQNVNIQIIHSDYTDNEYCPPERRAKYLNAVEGSSYLFNVWIKGYWGNKEVKHPFLKFFDLDKHTAPTHMDHNTQVYVTIDFNIEPFCATVWNAWFSDGIPHLHQVDEVSISDGTTATMAQELKLILGNSINSTMFGCDFMGTHGRIGRFDNSSLKKDLQRELGVSATQFKIKANPTHKTSANDCNYFFKNFPDIKIGTHLKRSIADYQTVEVDNYGRIIKRDRKDESQRSDFLDTLRYLINTFFKVQIENHKKSGSWF